MHPELLGSPHVVDGPRDRPGRLGCPLIRRLTRFLSRQQFARFLRKQRRRGDRPHGDPRRLDLLPGRVEHHRRPDAHHRDVHFIPRDEAQVVRATVRHRSGEPQFDHNLAPLQDVLARTGAELFDGNFPRPRRTGQHRLGPQGNQRGDGVARRARGAEVPADARPALNLDATDNAGAVGEGRVVPDDRGIFADAATGDRRPQPQSRLRDLEDVEFGQPLEIDHQFGLMPANPDLIDQIGPAGERPGGAIVLSQHPHRLGDRGGSRVIKVAHVSKSSA